MEQLFLSEEIIKKHWAYCKDEIANGLKPTKTEVNFEKKNDAEYLSVKEIGNELIKDIHENGIKTLLENLKDITTGKPKTLRGILKDLKDNHGQFIKMIEENYYVKYKVDNKVGKIVKLKYSNYILNIFGYKTFCDRNSFVSNEMTTSKNLSEVKNSLATKWTPYTFVFMSGVRVCPYCNRQYITPIYQHINEKNDETNGETHKLRPDLDHFFPKSKYPYFSMSIYNLVPCCKFCNSSLKGTKEFEIDDVNPYEEGFHKYFKFEADICNGGTINTSKKVDSNKIDRYLEIFQLESLYSYHENQAKELIKKRLMYPDEYIDKLYGNFCSEFRNKEHFKELLIGYTTDISNLNDEALAKFRRDIAEQLQFIKPTLDEKSKSKLEEISNSMQL